MSALNYAVPSLEAMRETAGVILGFIPCVFQLESVERVNWLADRHSVTLATRLCRSAICSAQGGKTVYYT